MSGIPHIQAMLGCGSEKQMTLRHYLMRAFVTTAALAIGQLWIGNPLHASEIASAVISSTQLTPTTFQYTMDLTDAGTTNIGTFWFSWVPGEGFMDSAPLSLSAPANWHVAQTDGPPPVDGYSIQWVAMAGAALTPGDSLSGFTFESELTPQDLAGLSSIHVGTPVLTSFTYSGAPFSDGGFSFVVTEAAATAAPEPTTLFLFVVGFGALAFARRYVLRRC
jgi:hypothetical protein